MKLTVFLLAIFFVVGCATDKKSDVETPSENQNQPIDIVRGYYNKVEKLQLPLVWENTGNEFPVSESKILQIEEENAFLFGKEAGLLKLMGVVADTSKFFTFLFYYPADDFAPYLITFDKKGNLIDNHMTGYNCGAGCGFYCNGSVFILNKDLSFLSRQVTYEGECEDDTDNMDTTKVYYEVWERKGKILANGKIREDEEGKQIENKEIPFNSPENPLNKIE